MQFFLFACVEICLAHHYQIQPKNFNGFLVPRELRLNSFLLSVHVCKSFTTENHHRHCLFPNLWSKYREKDSFFDHSSGNTLKYTMNSSELAHCFHIGIQNIHLYSLSVKKLDLHFNNYYASSFQFLHRFWNKQWRWGFSVVKKYILSIKKN